MSNQDAAIDEPTAKPVADPAVGDPKSFDLAGWIAGVRPVRRRVPVYGRGDLQAPIDELSAREALATGDRQKTLRQQLEALTDELQESVVVFEIEGRTSTWLAQFHADLKDAGVTDPTEASIRQLAAQIVTPQVTYEDLRALADVRDQEVMRLMSAAGQANSQPVTLDPRFLRGASD